MALSYFDEEVGGVEELWVTDGTSLGAHLSPRLAAGRSKVSRRSAVASSSL